MLVKKQVVKPRYGELAERSKAAVLKSVLDWSVYCWELYFKKF